MLVPKQISVRNIVVDIEDKEKFKINLEAIASDIFIHLTNDMEGREGGVYQFVWCLNEMVPREENIWN